MHVSRKVLYAGALVVLAGVIVLFYIWANGPEVTTPRVKSASTYAAPASNEKPSLRIEGLYYRLSLSGDFNVRERQRSPDATTLERFVATETTRGSGQLAVMVARLPAGGLTEVPGVRFRLQNPNMYETGTIAGAPVDALVFRSTGQYEVDVFWPHGDNYASIALSNSVGGTTAYDDDMRAIIANWVWLR